MTKKKVLPGITGLKNGWLLAVLLALVMPVEGQVVINELLASNVSTNYDDFFENDDWIELYNSGGIIDLAGHYLSDDLDSLDKWMFPETNAGLTTITPNNHLLVWIDKDPEQGEDHADFKLSVDGETVFLVDPDGTTILDSVTFGVQQPDISYGRACDGCEEWVYFTVPTPDDDNTVLPQQWGALYINEIQYANEATIFDEAGEFDAWLEVYNPNSFQINMANFTLELGGSNSWTIAADEPWLTTVPPEAFSILWLDGQPQQGAHHIGWELLGSGSLVKLVDDSGETLDEVEVPTLSPGTSSGRTTDGNPAWIDFATPTPIVTNQLILIPGGDLKINELQPDNTWDFADSYLQYEDWFEIHNFGSEAVDLGGFYLTDRLDRPMKWRVPTDIPDSTLLPPGGFVVFFADEDESQGWNHTNFRLSNNGEHLALRSPDGFSVVDSLNFDLVWANFSYGRLTDSATPWVTFSSTTPGYSNNGSTVGITGLIAARPLISPNPCLAGSTVQIPYEMDVYDLQGRLVRHFESGLQPVTLTQGIYVGGKKNGQSQLFIVE
jgi:hypothetical protein